MNKMLHSCFEKTFCTFLEKNFSKNGKTQEQINFKHTHSTERQIIQTTHTTMTLLSTFYILQEEFANESLLQQPNYIAVGSCVDHNLG